MSTPLRDPDLEFLQLPHVSFFLKRHHLEITRVPPGSPWRTTSGTRTSG